MTQSLTAETGLYDPRQILRAYFKDALGNLKETEVGYYLGKCLRWRVNDCPGTASESFNIYNYLSTAMTIDSPPFVSYDFCRGHGVVGTTLNITDMLNMVADRPTQLPSGEPQRYRQAEASTVEQGLQQSSTVIQQQLTKYLENTIDHLFQSAGELYFEDGMQTDFSRKLVSLVKKYGNLAMAPISYLIIYGRVDDQVASEALRWLARIDDPSSYGWRLWLLEKSLASDSPIIRDGAALGLVSMRDAHAIQYIRKAIEEEIITELRYDLQEALKELEASLDAAPATGNKQG